MVLQDIPISPFHFEEMIFPLVLLPPGGTCDEGTVHLVGSDDISRGRAIYCHNGTWHSLCRDHWNSTGEEAQIVCQALGYDTSRYGKLL